LNSEKQIVSDQQCVSKSTDSSNPTALNTTNVGTELGYARVYVQSVFAGIALNTYN